MDSFTKKVKKSKSQKQTKKHHCQQEKLQRAPTISFLTAYLLEPMCLTTVTE